MKKKRINEIEDQIYNWIDANTEIFNEIREDFEEHDVIRTVNNPPNFKCNDCGNCCRLDKFWIYCYATDINRWLKEKCYGILCSILPMTDENDNVGYGFSSQKDFMMKINEILKYKNTSPFVKNAYNNIRRFIKNFNTEFNSNSEYCIFYNPKIKKHCLIQETKPFSCRAYPFDHLIFSELSIPDKLSQKYITTKSSDDKFPMCPSECFNSITSKSKNKVSEKFIKNVLLDKVNYLSSTLIEDKINLDITDLLLKVFSSEIKLSRRKKNEKNEKKVKRTKKKK
ncbi:MAG: YkgJ family cysteine cluster protein [Promethearchaeota archaeon]